jgi:hypothetical protein
MKQHREGTTMSSHISTYVALTTLAALGTAGCQGTGKTEPAAGPQAVTAPPQSDPRQNLFPTPSPSPSPKLLPGPTRPAPRIWFEPLDLATNVGDTIPGIGIDADGFAVDDSVLSSVQRSLSLASWPGLTPVPSDVTAAQADPKADPRAHVYATPSKPLSDGWHVLRLAALPVGLAEPTYPSDTKFADGSIGVRFRRDSAPMLWSVRICEKGAEHAIEIDLTERVVSAKSIASFVTVQQPPKGSVCSTRESDFGSTGLATLPLSCTLDPAASITVRIAAGLAGLSGVPLNGGKDVSVAMVPKSLPAWGEGCVQFRPPDP